MTSPWSIKAAAVGKDVIIGDTIGRLIVVRCFWVDSECAYRLWPNGKWEKQRAGLPRTSKDSGHKGPWVTVGEGNVPHEVILAAERVAAASDVRRPEKDPFGLYDDDA